LQRGGKILDSIERGRYLGKGERKTRLPSVEKRRGEGERCFADGRLTEMQGRKKIREKEMKPESLIKGRGGKSFVKKKETLLCPPFLKEKRGGRAPGGGKKGMFRSKHRERLSSRGKIAS